MLCFVQEREFGELCGELCGYPAWPGNKRERGKRKKKESTAANGRKSQYISQVIMMGND